MRTIINLPDELIAQIKKLATASHLTVAAVIEDALREAIARRRRTGRRDQVTLITYGKRGFLPGADIDDTHSLFDLMGSSRDPAGRYVRNLRSGAERLSPRSDPSAHLWGSHSAGSRHAVHRVVAQSSQRGDTCAGRAALISSNRLCRHQIDF